MKRLVFSVLGFCSLCAMGAAEPLAVSDTVSATLETYVPHIVKRVDKAVDVTYQAGETVTVTTPSGTSFVLVETAESAGTATWTPSSAGLWTFANSHAGTTTLTVRYTDVNRGAGTAADPANIMDDEELADLAAAGTITLAGYVFRPVGFPTLLDRLVVPAGFAVCPQDGESYVLAAVADGCLFKTTVAKTTYFDTETSGPNRKVYAKESVPLAYSGDAWRLRTSDAAATVTVTAPSGTQTQLALTGTGVTPFEAAKTGTWTVTLTSEAGTQTAVLLVRGKGLQVILR